MGSPDERLSRSRNTHRSTPGRYLARPLAWSAILVGGFAIAGCGSDAKDQASSTVDAAAAGQVDDDLLDDLAEAQDKLTDLQESGALGSGSGVITIEAVDYSFEANTCHIDELNFEASGPGQTIDGVPFWATISHYISTRETMEASGLPAENIDAFFGDEDSLEFFELEVELGKEGQFGSGDDSMANYAINAFGFLNSKAPDYTIEGKTISGDGSVYDDNGVAIEYNELAPVTFSATCD